MNQQKEDTIRPDGRRDKKKKKKRAETELKKRKNKTSISTSGWWAKEGGE